MVIPLSVDSEMQPAMHPRNGEQLDRKKRNRRAVEGLGLLNTQGFVEVATISIKAGPRPGPVRRRKTRTHSNFIWAHCRTKLQAEAVAVVIAL